MIAAFRFTVASTNCIMNGFVAITIEIYCEALFGLAGWASMAGGFAFIGLEVWVSVVHFNQLIVDNL